MQPTPQSGYELCYSGARQRVSVTTDSDPDDFRLDADQPQASWLAWGRSAFAVAIVIVLVALGITNIALYTRWHEVEDGVLWGARPEGITALEIAGGSAAAAAGIEHGDVLLAVNGQPVETVSKVI